MTEYSKQSKEDRRIIRECNRKSYELRLKARMQIIEELKKEDPERYKNLTVSSF